MKTLISEISGEGHYFGKVSGQKVPLMITPEEPVGEKYRDLTKYFHLCMPFLYSDKTVGMIDIFLKKNLYINPEQETILMTAATSFAGVIVQNDTERELEENVRKMHKMIDRIIFLLSNILEQKDPYTAGHQQRVAKLASNIAWAAASDVSWLTVSPVSGNSSGTITLAAAANPGAHRPERT